MATNAAYALESYAFETGTGDSILVNLISVSIMSEIPQVNFQQLEDDTLMITKFIRERNHE